MPTQVQLDYRVRVSDFGTQTTFETVIQRVFDLPEDLAQARDQRLAQWVRELWDRDTGSHLGHHIQIWAGERFSIVEFDDEGRMVAESPGYLRSWTHKHKTDWTLGWHGRDHEEQILRWTERNEHLV